MKHVHVLVFDISHIERDVMLNGQTWCVMTPINDRANPGSEVSLANWSVPRALIYSS